MTGFERIASGLGKLIRGSTRAFFDISQSGFALLGIALAFARASRGFDGEHAERLSTWSIVFFLISLGCAVALGMMVGG